MQLQASCRPFRQLVPKEWIFLPVGFAALLVPSLVLVLALRRWWAALAITTPLVFFWSVASYYVLIYHSTPLTFSLLRSAKTALKVVSGYHFPLSVRVVLLCVLFVLQITGLLLLRRLERAPASYRSKTALWCGIGALASAVGVWAALFSPWALKPVRTIHWNWSTPVESYGYIPYLLEDLSVTRHPFSQPEGYDPTLLPAVPADSGPQRPSTACPDIILILNESFYDLSICTELPTDRPCLDQFYAIPNAVRGYAAVPCAGGATNDSEYELLTSNSMFLLNGEAPFNYLPHEPANSVARYLQAFGYQTVAMHQSDECNYSRVYGYPCLGFERSIFEDDFLYVDYYGDRFLTDAANYQDLIEQYEAAGPAPRLFYLLTFQNHGGYTQNDPSLATVHTLRNFGALDREINEYLSSLSLSDAALAELLHYFEGADRPVVVCMAGDHAPSFIRDLPAKPDLNAQDEQLCRQAVPFVIWANFPIEGRDAGFVSMTDLVPMLLQTAGVPLSTYYQTILDLQKVLPVRMSDGSFRDAAGNWGQFSSGNDCPELLQQYYNMEYCNLDVDECIPSLFAPAA